MPYDAGGLAPPSAASAATRRRTDANADPGGTPLDDVAAADEREAVEAPLPPPEQLTKWLGAIVKRDGLEALVKALLCAVPRDELMQTIEKLCNEQWGDEPLVTTDSGEVSPTSPTQTIMATAHSALVRGGGLLHLLLRRRVGRARALRPRRQDLRRAQHSWSRRGRRARQAPPRRCSSSSAAGTASPTSAAATRCARRSRCSTRSRTS